MILFEGIDKTGKSTLHKAFDKEVNYKYLTIERYFITYLAYCLRYERDIDWIQLFRDLPEDLLVVNLVCSDSEQYYHRMKMSKHEKINIELDSKAFKEALTMFNKIFSIENLNRTLENKRRYAVLTLDTSKSTLQECVNTIKEFSTTFFPF